MGKSSHAAPAGLRPMLEKAIAVCREHIRVGIELPRAYTTMGRLYLLLGQGDDSLCAYATAVSPVTIKPPSPGEL